MADTPEVPETPPTPPPPPRKKWRRGVVILLLTIIAIPVLIFSLWVWVTLGYVYSTGERAGYVQKLSKKGWLCKTWEGELAMVPRGVPSSCFGETEYFVSNVRIVGP